MRFPKGSVNQRLPSGPSVMSSGDALSSLGNSVTTPAGVMRPMWLPEVPPNSANQRLPSGPAVMPTGPSRRLRPVLELGDDARRA